MEISIVERLLVSADNDGGLQSMEIKGELRVLVTKEEYSHAHIFVSQGQVPDLQVIAHPSMNKELFGSKSVLTKKQGGSFPLNSQSQVLKWRITSKDEKMIPVLVTLWPEDQGNETVVPVEFEKKSSYDLVDLVISIPVRSRPKVGEGLGSHEYNEKTSTLDWHIPLVDSKNKSGSIEFRVPRVTAKS